MTTEPEVLEALPYHQIRRAWMVVLVLAVVCGVAWYADQRIRTREDAALAACERSLGVASAHADIRLGAVAHMLRPPMAGATGAQALHLADLMASPARRVLPEAQRADRVCQDVSLKPWHFSLVARRNAATAYSGVLVTLLQTVAAQGRAFFSDDATLQHLRTAAGLDGPD
ncbi:MAG TPA: hypothetical protein VHR35_02655 [Nocardioides sp.]|jgi:hypothetical protein|nr:hypothetical protein [Nocardioides sp.]HEX3297368.1 hypothetical protein [Nocardioides sp.]